METKPTIKYDDFAKLDMRVGLIESAEEIAGSEKLLKLSVDFGELDKRQVVSGIKKSYAPADLAGKVAVFVVNLESRMIMGLESQAMIMAAHDVEGGPVLLRPISEVPIGGGIN